MWCAAGVTPIPAKTFPMGRSLPSHGRPPAAKRPEESRIGSSTTSTATIGPGALRGIDEQVAKAENAVAGKARVKRSRFIRLTGATKSVNRDLEAKAPALAGLKGYTTNLTGAPAEFVIDAYHTTGSGGSRRASACPNTTYRPDRSTTTSANRSTPT
jgi:hypothetical protein